MANNELSGWMRRFLLSALLALWAFAATAGDKPDFLVDADWLAKNLTLPVSEGEAPYDEAFKL